MKKLGCILIGSLWIGGCAGTPPAWWTPNNTYPTTQVRIEPDSVSVAAPQKPAPVVKEETLALQDEAYEEMVLTPLQDEEQENDSGESSTQTVVPPADDGLPPPSILE